MDLNDKIWKELEGGYRIPYDVSSTLKRLETADTKEEIDNIFNELWEELHHQGDVGLASYLAVPQLVRIGKEKDLFDSNFLGICTVIEQQRHIETNPVLPEDFRQYYENGLIELRDVILTKINGEIDEITFRMACSALATASGKIKLGKAILELDEDIIDEFLNRF